MELAPADAPKSPRRPVRLSPWLGGLFVAGVVGWGFMHGQLADPTNPAYVVLWSFAAAGWAFIAAGMVAWARRPENRTGRLMVLCGFLFFFQSTLTSLFVPFLWTAATFLQSTFVLVLFYLMLGAPRARLTSWVDRALMVMVVYTVLIEVVANLFFDPRGAGCLDCPTNLNLFLIRSDPGLQATLMQVVRGSVGIVALLLAARLLFRYWKATLPARLVLAPMLLSTTVWLIGHSIFRFSLILEFPFPIQLTFATVVLLAAIPFTMLFAILRSQVRRARVGDMVVDLDRPAQQEQSAPEAPENLTELGPPRTGTPLRPWGAVLIVAGALAWAALYARLGVIPALWVIVIKGWGFIGAGMVAWARHPENPAGRLMVLFGSLSPFITFQAILVPAIWTAGTMFRSIGIPVLFYLVLAFPQGRLRSRVDRVLVLVVVLTVVVEALPFPFFDPRAEHFGCSFCPPGLNLLLIRSIPSLYDTVLHVNDFLILAVASLLAARISLRWRSATPAGRRVLGPLLLPTVAWLLTHNVVRLIQTLHLDLPLSELSMFSNIMLALIPYAFLVGLYRAYGRRSRVANLVVELDRPSGSEPEEPSGRVQAALARTLGDPSIEVGYWNRDLSRYSTVDGRWLELPEESSTRAATFLEREGETLAVILHDPALLEDRRMLDAAAAAARLAIENERLQAEVRAQLEEVRASRARIVTAGDQERKRVERNLHDGAQQRLLTLSLQLRMIEERMGEQADPGLRELVDKAEAEAGSALVELRELAQGVHPSILTDEGLGPAIEFLAERSPVPVDIEVVEGRYPEHVEATAYFVVAEALANVGKYAQANRVLVRVRDDHGLLHVEVKDDGIGGADPSRGSGLRGLEDRVAALGGRLDIKSAAGSGTVVLAEVPT